MHEPDSSQQISLQEFTGINVEEKLDELLARARDLVREQYIFSADERAVIAMAFGMDCALKGDQNSLILLVTDLERSWPKKPAKNEGTQQTSP